MVLKLLILAVLDGISSINAFHIIFINISEIRKFNTRNNFIDDGFTLIENVWFLSWIKSIEFTSSISRFITVGISWRYSV